MHELSWCDDSPPGMSLPDAVVQVCHSTHTYQGRKAQWQGTASGGIPTSMRVGPVVANGYGGGRARRPQGFGGKFSTL